MRGGAMDPGTEDFCEDCRSRHMIVDECGVSYECEEPDTCEELKEAERG